ncbi:hypothetical protein GUITHDRAFT_152170 [Guillardia theta CCMP2712]|uniref:Uncharacterized protein n=3 Tax=Guillardia theta TaxID=55529 RepID=L1JGC5_GUITC|nr:hypothetical protein GUITHDRAFT_152170 [Guillardia theta CCMP2712]EKX47150.1 hypothetical protein GUITHDRAFT_152170 [Guillardia theta CCMP2712]|eukprot:XP_005834130.1 hypothetical protein GUITHDRAFT_152170 [Guillardia theta CCMP2712]
MSVGHTPSGCFCRGSSYAIQWRTRKPGDDAGEVVLLSEEEDSGDDLHEPTSLLKDAYDGKNDPILKEKDLAPPSGSAESDESDSAMDQTLLEAVAQMPAKAAGVPEGLTEVNQESSQDKEAQGQTHLDDHESVGISQAVLLHSTCNAAMALKNKSTDSKVAQEELRRWTLEQELANIDKSRSNPGSAAKSEKKTPVMGHVLEFASRFGFWKEIAFGLPDHGEYLWTVPVDVEQGRYQLRVREVGKPLECSSYPITIRDNLLFLNPNQDAIWQMKSKQIIQWDSLGVATEMELSLESMSDSFVQMIEQSLDNSGTVSWTVSNSLSVGRYRLKITDKYRTVTAYSKDIMIVPPM